MGGCQDLGLTLAVHRLVGLPIRRLGLVAGLHVVAIVVCHRCWRWLEARRVRRGILVRLVANGRQLHRARPRIVVRGLRGVRAALIGRASVLRGGSVGSSGSLAVALVLLLTSGFFILLALLPLLADLLELCNRDSLATGYFGHFGLFCRASQQSGCTPALASG